MKTGLPRPLFVFLAGSRSVSAAGFYPAVKRLGPRDAQRQPAEDVLRTLVSMFELRGQPARMILTGPLRARSWILYGHLADPSTRRSFPHVVMLGWAEVGSGIDIPEEFLQDAVHWIAVVQTKRFTHQYGITGVSLVPDSVRTLRVPELVDYKIIVPGNSEVLDWTIYGVVPIEGEPQSASLDLLSDPRPLPASREQEFLCELPRSASIKISAELTNGLIAKGEATILGDGRITLSLPNQADMVPVAFSSDVPLEPRAHLSAASRKSGLAFVDLRVVKPGLYEARIPRSTKSLKVQRTDGIGFLIRRQGDVLPDVVGTIALPNPDICMVDIRVLDVKESPLSGLRFTLTPRNPPGPANSTWFGTTSSAGGAVSIQMLNQFSLESDYRGVARANLPVGDYRAFIAGERNSQWEDVGRVIVRPRSSVLSLNHETRSPTLHVEATRQLTVRVAGEGGSNQPPQWKLAGKFGLYEDHFYGNPFSLRIGTEPRFFHLIDVEGKRSRELLVPGGYEDLSMTFEF